MKEKIWHFLKEGDRIPFGESHLSVLETPGTSYFNLLSKRSCGSNTRAGHTQTCLSYVTNDKKMVFTGDGA